jgi:uncharacterized protein (TIGR00369 family)
MSDQLPGSTTADTDDPDDWGEPRSKTISWHDPMAIAARGADLSGLDFLQAMLDGALPPPPIAQLMRMTLRSVEPGRVEFGCEPDESTYNPIGVIHGGLVCTLLDTVTGCAAQTTLPQGVGYTSIEIKVSYLRPVHPANGPLTAVGTVVKPGRRVAFTDGVVTDRDGRPVATATSTLLVFPLDG